MNFQRRLAITPTSLHTIAIIVMVVWLVNIPFHIVSSVPLPNDEIGWWGTMPAFLRNEGLLNSVVGLLAILAAIYMIAELNIANVLLRINSRIFSIEFALLICAAPFLHSFNPGIVLMLCVLLSYFFLFRSYQMDRSSGLIYVAFLYLSIASLVTPKILWMAPFYWLSTYMLRSNNVKSMCASILGLLTPYWLTGAVSCYKDRLPSFGDKLSQVYTFHWGGYSAVPTQAWIVFSFLTVLFLIGVMDFFIRIYMDKTQIRNYYYIIILHGFVSILLFVLQPCLCLSLMPLILFYASFMFGHFICNGTTVGVSNIAVIVITVITFIIYILDTWIL